VLRAEVNDPSFVHQNSARVTAEIKGPSGRAATLPLAWDVKHEGQYGGSFKPLDEGVHEVTVTAVQGDRTLGAAHANFRIADSTEEFRGAARNTDLLKRLAAETRGRYYTPGDLRTLAEDIALVDNGTSRVEELDLWDMPLVFLLVAGFMAAEWAVRKRRGLA
jgi:hypothetical protein